MVFVDTSAWFAAVVPSDPNHPHAANWLATNSDPLITTDYIIDETLTLLRARGERQRAKLLGTKFFDGSIAEITSSQRKTFEMHGPSFSSITIRVGALLIAQAKS